MSVTTAIPTPSPLVDRGLYRYSVAVVVATLLLIKAGAIVTSTGSGMAFSDWPLADGQWWPPDMRLDQLFEHGHRAIGTTIGVLILILTVWVGVRERRGWLRKLATGVLALVVLQGLLGGMRIELDRYDPMLVTTVRVAHGVLAQVVLCMLALVAFALSPAWTHRRAAAVSFVGRARRMAAVAVALVFLQLLMGAIARHGNVTSALWVHIMMALLVGMWIMITAFYCSARFADVPGFRTMSRTVLVLLLAQLTLGFATLAVRRVSHPSNIEYLGRSFVATTHVVVGALLFLSSALLLFKTLRNLQPATLP